MRWNHARKIVFFIFFIGSALLWGALSPFSSDPVQSRFQDIDPALKSQLRSICLLVIERKSEDEILRAWDKFVDKSRRVNYDACIRFVFEEAKREAEAKARAAQSQIDQANMIKKALAAELGLLRKLRSQMKMGGPAKKFVRKTFEWKRAQPGLTIKESKTVATKEELDRYESYIQWAGKEAELQGTGGVALLEFAKDAIQTAVSNISGVGTLQLQMRKIVERKIGSLG
jgi:hypothetical protein